MWTRITSMRGSEMLRRPNSAILPILFEAPRRKAQGLLSASNAAALACIALFIAACTSQPPVQIQASASAVCEALRTDMPVKYRGNTTDAETVGNIRRANARYRAACP